MSVLRPRVLRGGAMWGERVAPMVMDQEHSLDIDTALDLELARLLLRQRATE